MEERVVVIGGGPAGLTAAYFLAREGLRTTLFERLFEGRLAHPCGSMVAPVRGHMRFLESQEGIYFEEAEFLFSRDMIVARPGRMEFIAPNGRSFGMRITRRRRGRPIFQLDKGRLLSALADRARAAGAELRFGTRVGRLFTEGSRVVGVVVGGEVVRAGLVLSAEGLSRRFALEAGLYQAEPLAFFHIASKEYSCPPLAEEELGQVTFMGQGHSRPPGSSMVYHTLGHDRLLVLLSVMVPRKAWPQQEAITDLLEGNLARSDWLAGLLAGCKEEATRGCRIIIQKPRALVGEGLIGLGDSVAPYGHSSIAIAMLMGRKAAELASRTMREPEAAAGLYRAYDDLLRSSLFRGVEFEGKLIVNMHRMSDEELDTLCDCLSGLNLEPFFVGGALSQATATLSLLVRPRVIRNWSLISRVFNPRVTD